MCVTAVRLPAPISCSQTGTAGRRWRCSGGPEVRGTTAARRGWSAPGAAAERRIRTGLGPTEQFYSPSVRGRKL